MTILVLLFLSFIFISIKFISPLFSCSLHSFNYEIFCFEKFLTNYHIRFSIIDINYYKANCYYYLFIKHIFHFHLNLKYPHLNWKKTLNRFIMNLIYNFIISESHWLFKFKEIICFSQLNFTNLDLIHF